MEAQIIHYRRGKRTQYTHQMIVRVPDVSTNEQAQKLVNKKVIWRSPAGKEIKGTVMQVHGNKGGLRVHFETGMPGQAIASKVTIQ